MLLLISGSIYMPGVAEPQWAANPQAAPHSEGRSVKGRILLAEIKTV